MDNHETTDHAATRDQGGHGSWLKFFAMIATSTVAMFALSYLTTYAFDHLFFNQTRMWMMIAMGAVMGVIMLAFMWKMYRSEVAKMGTVFAMGILFALGTFLARSQQTIGDEAWMKAMIPHHSIAVLTSSRAEISDPRVRKLADDIIKAQVKEIAEMKLLLEDIEANGEQGDGRAIPARSTDPTPELLNRAAKDAGLDPATRLLPLAR